MTEFLYACSSHKYNRKIQKVDNNFMTDLGLFNFFVRVTQTTETNKNYKTI